jgi:hypothetical protein
MYRSLTVSLLLLTACGDAHVQQPATATSTAATSAQADVGETTAIYEAAEAMDKLAQTIEQLPLEQRAHAVESLQILSVNCVYTRAALQIPFALSLGVEQITPDERVGPRVQSDWRALQSGLARHVDALGALGITLPAPAMGDYLHEQGLGIITDQATLMASPDPLFMTQALISAVPGIAQEVDTDVQALIEDHSVRVEQATGVTRQCPRGPWSVMPGHPWTLGKPLTDWQDALAELQPLVSDGVGSEDNERIRRMITLLQDYAAATQAHLGTR